MRKKRTRKYRRYRKNKSFKIKVGGFNDSTNLPETTDNTNLPATNVINDTNDTNVINDTNNNTNLPSTNVINDNTNLPSTNVTNDTNVINDNTNLTSTDSINDNSNRSAINKITSNIEKAHEVNIFPGFNLGNTVLGKKIIELSQGLALKTINHSAKFLNLNLNDSEQFKQSLEELKALLNDPKNIELMKLVVADFAKVGIIALDSARPFIDKLITEIFHKLQIIGSQWGQTGVKIALNTLEEIPGYGIIVGTVRSVSNIGEAFLASTNAASEIVTRTSDNVNAAVQNFDRLLQEKKDLITRTGGSIKKFMDNSANMPNNIKKTKTKKVRFKL